MLIFLQAFVIIPFGVKSFTSVTHTSTRVATAEQVAKRSTFFPPLSLTILALCIRKINTTKYISVVPFLPFVFKFNRSVQLHTNSFKKELSAFWNWSTQQKWSWRYQPMCIATIANPFGGYTHTTSCKCA